MADHMTESVAPGLWALRRGSSRRSRFQKREVSSWDSSPLQRSRASATRALRSSPTQAWRRRGRYCTRMTRRWPPSAMWSMPALSSSRAWDPREAKPGLSTTSRRRLRPTKLSVSSEAGTCVALIRSEPGPVEQQQLQPEDVIDDEEQQHQDQRPVEQQQLQPEDVIDDEEQQHQDQRVEVRL
ncbi:hypothetical protein CRUP_017174 [Coryphaenoides rupestris]|nr:hypothetical protein CRUP_017174 [Coryphaenoides rupestris]